MLHVALLIDPKRERSFEVPAAMAPCIHRNISVSGIARVGGNSLSGFSGMLGDSWNPFWNFPTIHNPKKTNFFRRVGGGGGAHGDS